MTYCYTNINKYDIPRKRDKSTMNNLKKIMFPNIEEEKLNLLMIDEPSISYITYASSAQEITNVIMNNLTDFPCPASSETQSWSELNHHEKMKHLVMTDMTAGVGGNVLNFSKFFKYVNAIEIDRTRYEYLKKNISIYNYINVNCYCDNSVNMLIDNKTISQDILFFDPPWGGKLYKLHDSLKLFLRREEEEDDESNPIEKIIKNILENETKMAVVKLPKNYDFEYFENELAPMKCSNFALDRMNIMIVKNY